MLKEFKEFALKGNVLDLAIAVIMGNTFSSIVSSLVNDIITPILEILIGGISFESLSVTILDRPINYGMFIQSIVDFTIVALSIFLFLKIVKKLTKPKESDKPKEEKAPEPAPTEIYLKEIRDLLKESK